MHISFLWVPYKQHLHKLYVALAEDYDVTCIAPANRKAAHLDKINVEYLQTDISKSRFVRDLLSKGSQVPTLYHELEKVAKEKKLSATIAMDVYQRYTWQLCNSKKRGDIPKLFLYAETKMWPRSFVARPVLLYYLFKLKLKQKHFDGLWVYSQAGKDFFSPWFAHKRITIIPAAVDTSVFYPSNEKVFLPNGVLRILMNARYLPYKNHEILLRAVAELIASGYQLQVTLIGRVDAGQKSNIKEIKSLITTLGLIDCVTFKEPVSQDSLREIYHNHDVLVLPSYNEAIGMVVPEAMACGLPTVTSDTVGANQYVEEGETGLIVTTGLVPELTYSLKKMHDKEILQSMSSKASRHVSEKYSIASVKKTILDTVLERG
jgi:glycosyltransferase involved in cell wall biosynthesis